MKKVLLTTAVAFCAFCMVSTAAAASLSPALDVISHSYEMTVSAKSGEKVVFSPETFEKEAGSDSYGSIRIVSLPDPADGTLMYNDASVSAGQVIPYDKIECLSFMPSDDAGSAEFEFTFDGSYTMCCAIRFDGEANNAPTAGPTPAVQTIASAECEGVMRAADADGDALSFEIVKYPENGKLEFNKSTGEFTYTPGGKAGSEEFTYRVTDSKGAVSDTAKVRLDISATVPSVSFADMDDSACVAAAVIMTDMGVMECSEKDNKMYFEPKEEVSRLEFLVQTMNAFGAKNLPDVSYSGFDDDDDIPAEYKPYVYSAKKLDIVNGVQKGRKCCFMPDRTITMAEASVIINNIMGYEAVSAVDCDDAVPTWARASVDAVYELGIADMKNKQLGVSEGITRETAAKMLYKVTSLIYE